MLSHVPARPALGTPNVLDFKSQNDENNNNKIDVKLGQGMLVTKQQQQQQYNHEDTVIGRSIQFLLQSYKCTGSGSLQIAATRLHQNAPNHMEFQKFSKDNTPPTGRLGLRPQKPLPDREGEKVAALVACVFVSVTACPGGDILEPTCRRLLTLFCVARILRDDM